MRWLLKGESNSLWKREGESRKEIAVALKLLSISGEKKTRMELNSKIRNETNRNGKEKAGRFNKKYRCFQKKGAELQPAAFGRGKKGGELRPPGTRKEAARISRKHCLIILPEKGGGVPLLSSPGKGAGTQGSSERKEKE